VTQTQVGLSNVQNFGIATLTDMTNGTSNQLYVTPYLVAQAINGAAGPGAALQAHINDHTNPHVVTAAQVNAYDIPTMNNLLAGKLGPNDTAGDSLKFNGMDQNTYAQFVLAQTASNSILFDGLTVAAFTAQVLTGTAANSNQLGGRTYAQVISDALSGKAADTFEFNGMDAPTYAAWVLANGTASNTAAFNGLSPSAFATYVLTENGAAANSNLLGGMTAQQIIAQAQSGGGAFAKATGYTPTSGEALTDYWTELAQIPLPAGGDSLSSYADTRWLVSGGDSNGALVSATYYVSINIRGTSPNNVTMDVCRLDPEGNTPVPANQFGYTIETLAGGPTVRVWLHTGPNLDGLNITTLSASSETYITNNRVGVAPTNIAYATTDAYVRESEFEAAIGQMTTMFENLTTQLSNA
jgi:hypothetical protein